MKTVHLILNAHIDPIWLWPWQAGLDAILNTVRSVCNLLERHEDAIFTCGEAWKYAQIERIDPTLFARVRALVKAGRFEPVGGWWIQPDCNLPSGWAMEKQIAVGQAYFKSTFGKSPRVAYNVDSFGHAASLPRLMRAAGQDAYVFMRPGAHEKTLPAHLFRWRGYSDDSAKHEVLAFRIAGAYGSPSEPSLTHVLRAIDDMPDGIDHTMCFLGLGDHGGGPNERLIAWIHRHERAIDGVRLVFSSPARFFAAVADQRDKLPLVTGELQHHAIGCYSVHRSTKVLVRRAEHLLRQAETAVEAAPRAEKKRDAERLEEAWKTVCFHHFHDTLGGSSVPSAYPQAEAQIGSAIAAADDILQIGLRRRVVKMPPDELGRIVIHNASDRPFAGYILHDLWPDFSHWPRACRLFNEDGVAIPHQLAQAEAAVPERLMTRLVWRMELAAGQTKTVRIDHTLVDNDAGESGAIDWPGGAHMRVDAPAGQFAVRLDARARMCLSGAEFPLPYLELLEDPSDTWSHEIDRYGEGPSEAAKWGNALAADRGPLMGAILQRGRIGKSLVRAEWRSFAQENFIDLALTIDWREEHKILKLTWAPLARIHSRHDGIMAGSLQRDLDGAERPLRDFMLLTGRPNADSRGRDSSTREASPVTGDHAIGIVCTDVFAGDVTPHRARLTLLRSPLMAHHYPLPANRAPRAVFADRGQHTFRFRFFAGPGLSLEHLETQAFMIQRPPLLAETTAGMPA